jgi:glycosyltransferase involved in cell wall biosynthesis
MPPRVTYWTSVWDPAKEAISKQVNALRTGSRQNAPVVALAPGQSFRFVPRERALVLPGRSWLALRGVAAVLERKGDITHVFGGRFSWHLFRALGRRPIVVTAVAPTVGHVAIPATIAHVVVETETAADEWIHAGVPERDISLIRPGVDLEWFRLPPHVESGRTTLLFASTPADPADIDRRGIPLLIELARLRPDIDIIIPWRQWGNLEAVRQRLEALRIPRNVVVTHDVVDDLRPCYARAHATVVCFEEGAGKSCPAFVVEGLAAGRPCVTTSGGLSSLIARSGAGLVVGRAATSLAAAVDEVRSGWPEYARRARRLAEEEFDVRAYRRRYEDLYLAVARQKTVRQ